MNAPIHIVQPGVYQLTNEEYHNGPGISKSGLDLINKCPAMYLDRYMKGNQPAPTPAMELGTAIHTAILEPKRFAKEYISRPPGIDGRTKAGKIALAEFMAEAEGKIVLPKEELVKICQIADAVNSHPIARSILGEIGYVEQSLYAEIDGVMAKARPDYLLGDYVVDLKTAVDASREAFSRACWNYRYHVQAALYTDVAEILDGAEREFIFIVVEKTEPYPVAVYYADIEMVSMGREQYRLDLETYRQCLSTNTWPGYNEGRITSINLPKWAKIGGSNE